MFRDLSYIYAVSETLVLGRQKHLAKNMPPVKTRSLKNQWLTGAQSENIKPEVSLVAKIEKCWTKMSCRDLKGSNLPNRGSTAVYREIPDLLVGIFENGVASG